MIWIFRILGILAIFYAIVVVFRGCKGDQVNVIGIEVIPQKCDTVYNEKKDPPYSGRQVNETDIQELLDSLPSKEWRISFRFESYPETKRYTYELSEKLQEYGPLGQEVAQITNPKYDPSRRFQITKSEQSKTMFVYVFNLKNN